MERGSELDRCKHRWCLTFYDHNLYSNRYNQRMLKHSCIYRDGEPDPGSNSELANYLRRTNS